MHVVTGKTGGNGFIELVKTLMLQYFLVEVNDRMSSFRKQPLSMRK